MVKATDNELRVALRAVVYPHRKWWIAHCLELDLVAEGKSPEAALNDLMDLSITQVETAAQAGNLESVFCPAPPEIWTMFARAVDAPPLKRKPTTVVERFEAREAALAQS
jgi:hypothetical protein